jgi:hypothetical protein
MKPCILTIGLICLVGPALLASDSKSDKATGDARAQALMEEAARTRYVWSPEIASVSGKFTWALDGQTGEATFRRVLHQKGKTSFVVEGNVPVPQEVKDHIASLISHRTSAPPGAPSKAAPPSVIVVEDDDRGPLIMTVGDPMQSTSRVKDGKMVQVNRTMGGQRFTIDVTEFEKSPDGRYFSSAFTVTYWDAATGKRVEKQTYSTQGFDVITGQMFPKAEKVSTEKDGKTSTLELKYSGVKFELPDASR